MDVMYSLQHLIRTVWIFGLITEAVVQRYSVKKMFLKIPQICRNQAWALEIY